MSDIQIRAMRFFEDCGFRVVHATKEDCYILTPNDIDEHVKYGTAVLSPRAMQAIALMLTGGRYIHAKPPVKNDPEDFQKVMDIVKGSKHN